MCPDENILPLIDDRQLFKEKGNTKMKLRRDMVPHKIEKIKNAHTRARTELVPCLL